MTNILNWPDYKVLQVSELEHDYQVHAEVSEPPTHCPRCNHPEIVGFGRRDEVIMDTPVHGKRDAGYRLIELDSDAPEIEGFETHQW